MKKSCMNCTYFKLSEKPPKMRGCTYKGKIEMHGAFCGCWKNQYSFFDRLLIKANKKKVMVRSLVL